MGKEALVVDRNVLFEDGVFHGFLKASNKDYISVILNNHRYHPRGDELENNPSLQQVIPYVWIVDSKNQRVFAYKRAAGTNYKERRLRNKWSCGLGGHIERIDSHNPIMAAMMRELQEEVKMPSYPAPRIVGYVKNDDDEVGKVHFGVVAVVDTEGPVTKGDEEMAHGRLHTLPELEALFADTKNNEVETWTRISWPFIKDYLNKL